MEAAGDARDFKAGAGAGARPLRLLRPRRERDVPGTAGCSPSARVGDGGVQVSLPPGLDGSRRPCRTPGGLGARRGAIEPVGRRPASELHRRHRLAAGSGALAAFRHEGRRASRAEGAR
jgi:hypothetical protein